MIRAFLAVELRPDLRAALSAVQQDLKRRLERTVDRQARISWVQPASMHLTVKFLGDTPEDLLESLHATLAQVVANHRMLQVPFSRLGTFPRPQQPRVLWAGPLESWEKGSEGERLQALYRAVEESCRAAGLAAEVRPFSPHLTLARIKEGERLVGQALAQSGLLDHDAADQPFLKAFNTPNSLTIRTFQSPFGLNAVSDFNQSETWARGYASMGGVGSASGLAKFYAMLADGGRWLGVEAVPPAVMQQLDTTICQNDDAVLLTTIAFAAGVMHDPLDLNPESETHGRKLRQLYGPSEKAFGHPGAGGSLAFADPENGIALAYVMNQMETGALPGDKVRGLVDRLYA